MMMMMMTMMSNMTCKSRITMSNATQVLRGQISLQHVQHSLTDAAESLLGARAKKPTGHQEVAGASLSRMLFWSKKLHGMRWQYSANTGKVWCYELWSSLIWAWGSSTKQSNLLKSLEVAIRFWSTSGDHMSSGSYFGWFEWSCFLPGPEAALQKMVTYVTVFSNAGLPYLVLGVPRFSSSSYLILKLILDFLKKPSPPTSCFLPRIKAVAHIGKEYNMLKFTVWTQKCVEQFRNWNPICKLSQYHLILTLQP